MPAMFSFAVQTLARIRRWSHIHLRGALPIIPRARGWLLGRRGEHAAAAGIWRGLARQAQTPSDDRREKKADTAAIALAWAQHGRYCREAGDLTAARAALERALAARPDYPLARELLGWTAMAQADWAAAEPQWRALLRMQAVLPGRARCLRFLVEIALERNEFDEAAGYIDRLAEAGAKDRACQIECIRLRARLARKQMDDHGRRAAWAELHQRFPKAAENTPGWLAYVGGEDPPDKPRYTPDDVAAAADPRAAARALSYLELRLPRREHLALAAQAAAAYPDSDEIQRRYLACLDGYLSCAAEAREFTTAARAFAERFPEHPQSEWWPAAAAVAANDAAAVERFAPDNDEGLRIWLAAKRGEHDAAYALSARRRRKHPNFAEDPRGLDLRLLSAAPRRALRDKILVFACFRDERVFAPWFFDYYRSIGVDWFFIVDNQSTDGTAEFLCRQKDATVFASADSHAATANGMRRINELIRRHGDGAWCVFVDADERLVAPGIETRGLRGVVDDMAARGEEAMPAFMLDTQPTDLKAARDFRPGDDPLAVSNLIDTDYFFFGGVACCFRRVRGGARDRLFDFHGGLAKAPILRGGRRGPGNLPRVYLSNHTTSYARVSATGGALLHHKLLREAIDMTKPRDQAASRVNGRDITSRARHVFYRGSGLFAADAAIPRGPNTVEYKDSAQLERLGLIGDFAKVTGNETRTT